MVYDIIHDIMEYIECLKKHGLLITFHMKYGIFRDYIYLLTEGNIHNSSYCLYVKSDTEAWSHCVECQKKIFERLEKDGAFLGMCYAGVEEYIFPVKDEEIFAFISVSGYGINKAEALPRMRHISERYMLSYDKLNKIYDDSLTHCEPKFEEISALVMPLCHMLIRLKENINSVTGIIRENNKDYFLNSILMYINRNYSEKITLDKLSEIFHCSNSYISHMLKSRTGKSLRRHITELRIEYAKKLLLNSAFSVTDIAETVGYENVSYFISTFTQECGESPYQWRKNYSGK